MMNDSWTDALIASLDVGIILFTNMPPGADTEDFEFTASKFTIYRVICERLETNDRIFDASKCFLQMVNELARETVTHGEQAEWVDGERAYTLCRVALFVIDII